MSDSHDNIHKVGSAVKFFNEINVSLVLHAGDFVSPFVPKWFKELRCKMIGVFGNNENERSLLIERFKELGHEIRGYFTIIKVEGRRIALLHGHERDLLEFVTNCNYFDFVIYGHTHEKEIRKIGNSLVINPGEVCGYLSGEATVAVLDVGKREVRIHVLD